MVEPLIMILLGTCLALTAAKLRKIRSAAQK